MSQRNKFDLDYSSIPLVFESMFGSVDVFIGLNYNETGKFFTVDLLDASYNPIILGEKIVYGERFWKNSVDTRVPSVDLIMLDESGKENEVTKDNLGVTVFLFEDTLIDETGGSDNVETI